MRRVRQQEAHGGRVSQSDRSLFRRWSSAVRSRQAASDRWRRRRAADRSARGAVRGGRQGRRWPVGLPEGRRTAVRSRHRQRADTAEPAPGPRPQAAMAAVRQRSRRRPPNSRRYDPGRRAARQRRRLRRLPGRAGAVRAPVRHAAAVAAGWRCNSLPGRRGAASGAAGEPGRVPPARAGRRSRDRHRGLPGRDAAPLRQGSSRLP